MAASGIVHEGGQRIKLLDAVAITAAVTGAVSTTAKVLSGAGYLGANAVFTYVSGGTNAKFWLQTSFDGGATWDDIINFAFLTATLQKVAAVSAYLAATHATPTDGTLADNTVNQGLLGTWLRVKYTTTGIYVGATISINAVLKG